MLKEKKIPRRLIQFWHNKSTLPIEYKEAIEHNKQYLNGFEILFADDEYMLNFFKEKNDTFLYELYQNIQIESLRSDIARIVLLYEYGGIYLDISMVLSQPLYNIIKDDTEVALLFRDDQARYSKYPENAHIANGILCSVSASPFLKECFVQCLDSIIDGRYNHLVLFAITKNTYISYINYISSPDNVKICFEHLSFKELKKKFLKHLRIKNFENSWKSKEQEGIINPKKLNLIQEKYILYKAKSI